MKSENKANTHMCDIFEAMMLKLVFWSLGNKVF